MSLPVHFHAQARVEYDTAADLYEQHSAGLGARFTAAVDVVVTRIGEFPETTAFSTMMCVPPQFANSLF